MDGKNEIPYQERRQVFGSYFQKLFEVLSTQAENIIIVGPLPLALTFFNKRNHLLNPQKLPTVFFERDASEFRALIRESAKNTKFHYLDIASEVCGSKSCRVTKDGLYLYSDEIHFSDYGQSVIMKPLFRKVLNKFLL